MAELAGLQERIQRHGDRSHTVDRHVRYRPLGAVLTENADVVARRDADPHEPGGELVDLLGELSVADFHVAGATKYPQRHRIAGVVRRVSEHSHGGLDPVIFADSVFAHGPIPLFGMASLECAPSTADARLVRGLYTSVACSQRGV